MRGGFIICIILFSVLVHIQAKNMRFAEALSTIFNQKKTNTERNQEFPILRAHGSGITDGQQTLVINFIDQAEQKYGGNLYDNAKFIQQKVQDSFAGKWNVQIFGGDPSWGRATYVRNQQWVILVGYGSYDWDYIIWAPDC